MKYEERFTDAELNTVIEPPHDLYVCLSCPGGGQLAED